MKRILVSSLKLFLEGEAAKAKANVSVYLKYPAGIGEHPDVVEAMRSELSKLSQAEEDLATLEKHFTD